MRVFLPTSVISGRKVEWESEESNRKEALSFSCADPIRPIMIEIIVFNTPLFMLGMISDANSKRNKHPCLRKEETD